MAVLGTTLAVRLVAALILLAALLLGCGEGTPNDPEMTPEQEAADRQGQFTPEQEQSRSQRPR